MEIFIFRKKKTQAGPKYTRTQNDEVEMSCTLHGRFIPHSFQTGLPFYSPPTPQTTSLVFPLPSLPLPATPIASDHILLFLAPENPSICSRHPIPIVTPAMEASSHLGNILFTGPPASLDHLKSLHRLPMEETFLKHKQITYSSQVPCGVDISSRPHATAILCLSLCLGLQSSLWLKSIALLPFLPQVLMPSHWLLQPCASEFQPLGELYCKGLFSCLSLPLNYKVLRTGSCLIPHYIMFLVIPHYIMFLVPSTELYV